MSPEAVVVFERGRLFFPSIKAHQAKAVGGLRWDPEGKRWWGEARCYRDVALYFHKEREPLVDRARAYEKLDLPLRQPITPRPHQKAALAAWQLAGRGGVVSMPTGSGKTILAVMALNEAKRPALVVVPTIDLLHQWQKTLKQFFDVNIGVLGGGRREFAPITVATYDSALLMIEEIGNSFGLLICDECHHLPASQYQQIARAAIAPFRLGLSATVERADGREEILFDLMGDLVYEIRIHEVTSKVLSPYDVVNIQVPLSDEELEAYQAARQKYLKFVRRAGVSFQEPRGWQDFIRKASRSPEGREALKSHRLQKKLAQGAESKLRELWKLLCKHRDEQVIVFTDDNDLAYRIGRHYILPVLTYQTKTKERKILLDAFRAGKLNVLVTSKVLNEGVDVPEASVGIVVSGSGGVREHVQRLGRILRHAPGKRAVLYELVSKNTSEQHVNWRRRQHDAYQRTPTI